MLAKYRPLIASLSIDDASYLRSHFHLCCRLPLVDALEDEFLDQADVVLALLHGGRHRAVELMIGRPIEVLPSQPSPCRNLPLPRAPEPAGDERRVRLSVPSCPLTVPTARARWALLARCRTVQGYLSRVPRWRALRDLREWAAAGWVEVLA